MSRAAVTDEERIAQANILVRKEQFREASERIEAIKGTSPCVGAAALAKAKLLWAQGRRESAVLACREAVERTPQCPGYRILLTELLLASGQKQEALNKVEAIQTSFRGRTWVQLRLARVLSRQGELGHALRVALDAETIPATSPRKALRIAQLYLKAGLPALALRPARNAAAEAPRSAVARLVAGKACRALGRVREASACFERALEKAPNMPAALLELGQLRVDTGEEKMGLRDLRRAAELSNSGPYLYAYGAALMRCNRPDEAAEQLRRAVERLEDPSAALVSLGNIARSRSRARRAMEYYARALRVAPRESPLAANNLAALMLDAYEDPPVALGLAMHAYFGSSSGYLKTASADTLAEALIRTGYPARAVHPARQVVRKLPEVQECQLRLGIAEAAAGNTASAREAFGKTIELDAETPVGRRARELLASLDQGSKEGEATDSSGGNGQLEQNGKSHPPNG
jgi:tetratricopeptide (TPR) repeat protein